MNRKGGEEEAVAVPVASVGHQSRAEAAVIAPVTTTIESATFPRSAPLNLDASAYDLCSITNGSKRISIASKIISDHHGPGRRFVFRCIRLHKAKEELAEQAAQIERWFRSRALANLQELDISFQLLITKIESERWYPLPLSLLRVASTLLVARIGLCRFPSEIALAPCLNFPLLREINLWIVSIPEEVLSAVLSACHVLETLFLQDIRDVSHLSVSSQTLRIIAFSAASSGKQELVIDDAPSLERLVFPDDGESETIIRVNRAPKLQILGPLSPCISQLEITNLVFQGMVPKSLKHSVCNVNVLALKFSGPDLDAIIQVLRCFPCLEKLYIIWDKYPRTNEACVRQYDPLEPVACLETHLQKLVFKIYTGSAPEVDFAKFFLFNAKVVKEIIFGVCGNIDRNWVANQHMLLEVKTTASQDAQLVLLVSITI